MTNIPSSPRFVNLTAKKFNRWEVVSYAGKVGHHHRWKCRCDCGVIAIVYGGNLTRNLSRSCGCHNSEVTAARNAANATHGQSGNGTSGTFATPEYNAWVSLIKRCCSNTSKEFRNYGGRGITVCDRWLNSFENFFADMGTRPSDKHSIDRYPDNNGNYEPSNCRWATKTEQDRNKRTNRMVTHDGVTLCVTEWSERLGIHKHTIFSRLRKGLSPAEALAPVK